MNYTTVSPEKFPALAALNRVKAQPALMALAEFPIWCVSGGTLPSGKPDKSPRNPRNPQYHAKSNDPKTWGTLAQVEQAVLNWPELVQHFGIVSGPHARVLDWDYKPHAEQPLSVATQATLFSHCYQELSLSGRGLRCLLLADGLDFKKQKFEVEEGAELEVFASHQYAILTGNVTNPAGIEEAGAELLGLIGQLAPVQVAKAATVKPSAPMRQSQGQQGQAPWEAAAEQWSMVEMLSRYGYERRGEGRYLSPTSQTGLAGVNVFTDDRGRQLCYSHHSNDPLNNGHANDVFDVFAILEHAGDYKAAAKQARELLGLNPTREPEQYPYTLEQARELWEAHGTDVLSQAGEYLSACNLHHHAREALVGLTATIYQLVSEGRLRGSRAPFSLDIGSIKQLAALVGGRPGDCKPRLEWLASNGLIGALRRMNHDDPRSGYAIDLPADPRDLRFLALTPNPTTPAPRPQTKDVRRGEKPISDTLPYPRYTCTAKARGRVESKNTKNPLRALLSLVLCIGRNKNIGLKSISQKMGMRLQTVRRKWTELQELGYLDVSGNLTCTVDQFLQDMRAVGAEGARQRLINTLERQREYAAEKLARICFLGLKKQVARYERMRARCEEQLERLHFGEAPYAVLGRVV